MPSRVRRGRNKKGGISCPICLRNFAASASLQQENLLLDHMMKCSAVSTEPSTSMLQPSPASPLPYAPPRNTKRDDEKPYGITSPNPSVPSLLLLHLSDESSSSSSHSTGETSTSRVDSSSDDTYASAAALIQPNQPNVHIRMTPPEFPATVGSLNLSRPAMVRVENPIQDLDLEKSSGLKKKHQTYSCNISDVYAISEGHNCTGTSSRTLSPTLHGMPSSNSILEEERSALRNNPSAARQNQKDKNTTTKDVEHNTWLNHSPGTQALARNPVKYLQRKGNKTGVPEAEDNLNLSCMKTSTAPTRTTSSVISTTLKTGIRAGEKHSLAVNERRQLKKRSTRSTCTAECPICMRVFHTTTKSLTEINQHIMSCSDLQERMASRISKSQGKSRKMTQSMAKPLPSNVCDKKRLRSTLAKQRASRAESVKSLRHGAAHRVIRHILLRDWDPSMSNEGSTDR